MNKTFIPLSLGFLFFLSACLQTEEGTNIFNGPPPEVPDSSVTPKPLFSAVSIPMLSKWESNFKTYAESHCDVLNDDDVEDSTKLTRMQGDSIWIFYEAAEYFKDNLFEDCATEAVKLFRDTKVLPNGGSVAADFNFTMGLLKDYQMRSNSSSRNAIVQLSTGALLAREDTAISDWADPDLAYHVGQTLISYLNAEALGQSRRVNFDKLVLQNVNFIYDWFRNGKKEGLHPVRMAGVLKALIYHHTINEDPRVLPLVRQCLDWLWENNWSEGSFKAWEGGEWVAKPNYSLFVAPVFAWMYHQTGKEIYQIRGDTIFTAGVQNVDLSNYWYFNISYQWTTSYVKWRLTKPLNYKD